MFVSPELSKVDTSVFHLNFDKIKKDYIDFRDNNYFIDYSHTYNLTSLDGNFFGFVPTCTPEFPWKVCPLIFNRQKITRTPPEVQNSSTVDILLSQTIKPVLAVFSILEPGVELEPHSDGDERIDSHYWHSSVIKYHFSLDIPNDAPSGLVVNEEERILQNGDLNLFDEKLSAHYAYNRSSNRRGVLIASYIREEVLSA